MSSDSCWADMTDVTDSKMLWRMFCCLQLPPAWLVWSWISDLDRPLHRPPRWSPCRTAVRQSEVRSSDSLSDHVLMRWAVGSLWCMTTSSLMWLECVSTSWMMKALMLLTGLHVLPTLDRIKHLWDSKYHTHLCHVAPWTVQLTDVLTQVWEEIWDEGFQCFIIYYLPLLYP